MGITIQDRRLEGRLRRLADRHGFRLIKSRVREPHWNDRGGYILLTAHDNSVANGTNFELTLTDVQEFISREIA
jgi:hypothetical protein